MSFVANVLCSKTVIDTGRFSVNECLVELRGNYSSPLAVWQNTLACSHLINILPAAFQDAALWLLCSICYTVDRKN